MGDHSHGTIWQSTVLNIDLLIPHENKIVDRNEGKLKQTKTPINRDLIVKLDCYSCLLDDNKSCDVRCTHEFNVFFHMFVNHPTHERLQRKILKMRLILLSMGGFGWTVCVCACVRVCVCACVCVCVSLFT